MRARKLTHIQEPQISEFDWIPGFFCHRCQDYKGLTCEHNFEDDPKRVFEVMYCSFCGDIIEESDVTYAYERRNEDSHDEQP